MKSIKYLFFALIIIITFSGCNSLKQPESIQTPLNYTDDDVIKNEIERINEMMNVTPVKALWRAVLLGNQDVIDTCYDFVKLQFNKSIDDMDYTEAYRYYISLKTVCDDEELKDMEIKLNDLYLQDAFIFADSSDKLPKTIDDCIKATVTVWVDKGLKVENGAGLADITIGSGFFIDKRGYIVTNHHVIEDCVNPKYEGYSRLYVKMHPDTDTKIPAKVIGYDSILDLALLKVEVEPDFVLALGKSSDLHIGDKVSAIGTPIGLEGTLTSGIISSVDRKLLTLGNVFQIDAAVNSGNSGGPLIDERMQVQAIVFAGMLQFQGLNFAIPVEFLTQELQHLYAGGEVQHSWIACYGRTARKGKNQLGLEIQYVIPGCSGCMSGLKEDDIIIEAAGNKISNIDDFQMMLMTYEPGTIISCISKSKNGEEDVKYLYLEKRSETPNDLVYKSDFITGSFIPMFGMKLKPASTINRNSYIIDRVIRGGIADETGFSEGDSVVVKDVKVDTKNKFVATQIYTKRRSKGFLDVTLVLSNSIDSPYYF